MTTATMKRVNNTQIIVNLIFVAELAVKRDVGDEGSRKFGAAASKRQADSRHDVHQQTFNVHSLGNDQQFTRPNHATRTRHNLQHAHTF